MSAEQNKQYAREMYDAWSSGNIDRCVEMTTDDVEITAFAFGAEPKRGRDAFREQLQIWRRPFPDGNIQIVKQYAGDDFVVNECVLNATNTGPLLTPQGEIPATGKRAQLHFVEVWTIRDGKTSSLHNYADNVELMMQLGLMPQPAGATA